MILYHASNLEITVPDLIHSRNYLDFGKGFYLTSLKGQALKYAERFILRNEPSFINEYEMSNETEDLSVLNFDRYDEGWLDFIGKCRKGNDDSNYDIIEGGIANDRIFRTLDLYFSGDITKDDALKRLIYEQPNNQFCFRTEASLSKLTFIKAERLK